MIDSNMISYGISVALIFIGIISFAITLKFKYLNGFVILSVGQRIAYWVYDILKSEEPRWLILLILGFFCCGIFFSALGILLKNDVKEVNDDGN